MSALPAVQSVQPTPARPEATPRAAALAAEWPGVALVAVAAALLFYQLGQGTLADWDEAIFAQVAREMLARGDWLSLTWNYEPYFNKPPLLMWLTASLYLVFGISEWTARAVSATAGVALVSVTYAVGRAVADRLTAALGAIVLLTSLQFLQFARFGTTDVLLTLCVYTGLFGYFRLRRGSPRWWYLAWAAFGAACMVKGAGALILPATIGVAILLDGRIGATLRARAFWLGLLLAAAIALPWHALAWLHFGRAFLDQYIGFSVATRATEAVEGNTGDSLFYVDVLRQGFAPWLYLAPFAAVLQLRQALAGRRHLLPLLVLAVLVFGLYTLVPTKLRWYIIPLYPALALLVAAALRQAVAQPRSIGFVGAAIAAFGGALLAPVPLPAIVAGAALVFGALLAGTRRRPLAPLAGVGLAAGLFVLAAGNALVAYEPADERAVEIAATALHGADPDSGEPLIVFEGSGLHEPAALFYSGHPVRMVTGVDELALLLADGQERPILAKSRDAKRVAGRFDLHGGREIRGIVVGRVSAR